MYLYSFRKGCILLESSATLEKIEPILNRLKICLESNCFLISHGKNRKANEDFLKKYNLDKNKQIEMLKCLSKEDFSKSEEHRNHKSRILYFFGRNYELTNKNGTRENVEVYVKFYITEDQESNDDFTIIISFHPARYSIIHGM